MCGEPFCLSKALAAKHRVGRDARFGVGQEAGGGLRVPDEQQLSGGLVGKPEQGFDLFLDRMPDDGLLRSGRDRQVESS